MMMKMRVIFLLINLCCLISFSTQVNYDTESSNSDYDIENQCDGYNYKFYQQYSDFCPKLLRTIETAENIAFGLQNLTETLFQKGYYVSKDQPAFGFFSGDQLDEITIQRFFKSDVALKLSEYLRDAFFEAPNAKFCNLTPFLKHHSKCLREYFADIDVMSERSMSPIKHSKYQPIDGFGINLNDPKQGATDTPFSSMIFPIYNDGIQEIRKSVHSNRDLPSPRLLSELLTKSNNTSGESYLQLNLGGIIFGQLVAHDTSFKVNPQRHEGGPGLRCCTLDGSAALPVRKMHPLCEPIIGSKGQCTNFIRAQCVLDNDCLLSPRLQMNRVTSLPDLSNIYGSNKAMTSKLRGPRGTLKLGKHGIFAQEEDGSFILPDVRARQTPVLVSFHALFTREHNRIARELRYLHPKWGNNKLFNEARRWNIAQYNYILYNEWLPLFIDPGVRIIGSESNDPTTSNDFTHSAFRALHFSCPDQFNTYNSQGKIQQQIKLSDSIGKIKILETEFDDVVRSYFYQKASQTGPFEEITEYLFKNKENRGIDLVSFDILRGRDCGVAPYYIYVYECHGIKLRSFDDLTKYGLMAPSNVRKIQWIYESIFDVDLYVAGLLEIRHQNYFGPTISCIIGEQFSRWRDGNVYFYNHPENPYPFLPEQLEELRQASWARIICDNTGVEWVPQSAFLSISKHNPLINCAKIAKVNLY